MAATGMSGSPSMGSPINPHWKSVDALNVVYTGRLRRRRKRVFGKAWKTYWAVLLASGDLRLFSSKDAQLMGEKPEKQVEINSSLSLRQAQHQTGKEHSFGLFSEEKERFFAAKTEEERDEWMTAIRHIIGVKCSNVSLADFEVLALIGAGAHGQVLQARKKSTGELFALKVIKKMDAQRHGQIAATQAERRVLEVLNHPFIVKLHYAFQTRDKICFVLDLVNGGDFFSLIQRQGALSENNARFYIAQLVLALEYLHGMDIVYRDLKPENVLLDQDGYIRLTDFGLARDNVTSRTNSLVGSPYYIAPEVMLQQGHDQAADWWSLGILLYEMIHATPPFFDAQNAQKAYERLLREPLPFQEGLSADACDLLRRLITVDPTKRLGANMAIVGTSSRKVVEIRLHPFFAPINWERLHDKLETPPLRPAVRSATDLSHFDSAGAKPEGWGGREDYEIDSNSQDMWEGFGFYSAKQAASEKQVAAIVATTAAAAPPLPAASFRRMLVPVDSSAASAHAVHVVVLLCKLQGPGNTAVRLLQVVEGGKGKESEARGLLARFHAQFLVNGIQNVTNTVISNVDNESAAHVICRESQGFDMVVMGTRGRSGMTRAMLGSVTESVIRSKTTPVLAVRELGDARHASSSEVRFDRVCVPIDGTEISIDALRYGVQFASSIGCPNVTAMTIAKPPDVADREAALAAVLTEVRAVEGVTVMPQVIATTKSAAEGLLEVLNQRDVVVMGTRGRKGMKRIAMGSIAEQLLRSSTVPVLVVPRRRGAGDTEDDA